MKAKSVSERDDEIKSIYRRYRVAEIDVLKGIAILFVVLIHSIGGYVANLHPFQVFTELPIWLRIIQSALLGAVPTFIFASGFLYGLSRTTKCISSQGDMTKYIVRRAERLLTPYAMFSFLYIIIRILVDKVSPVPVNEIYTVSISNIIFMGLGFGSPAPHLSFLILLFIISIVFAILDFIIPKHSLKIWGLGLLSGLCSSLALYFELQYPLNSLTYLFIYYIGWFISYNDIGSRIYSAKFVISVGLIFGTIFILRVLSSNAFSNHILTIMVSQLMPLVILFLSHNLYTKAHKLAKLFASLGAYSISIYLLHEPFGTSLLNAVFYRLLDMRSFVIGVAFTTAIPIVGAIVISKLLENFSLYTIIFRENYPKVHFMP